MVGILLAFFFASAARDQQPAPSRPIVPATSSGADIAESMLQRLDPSLLQRAGQAGLYRRDDYPVRRALNPFFLSGDFDGDGVPDIAVSVTQRSSGLNGVIVVPGHLRTVYFLGAGHSSENLNGTQKRGEVDADAWRVLSAGSVVRSFTTLPEVGAVSGRPFTFTRDSLEFHWLGKSSFAFLFQDGRFWEVWTGD